MTLYNINLTLLKEVIDKLPKDCKYIHISYNEKNHTLVINPVDPNLPKLNINEDAPSEFKLSDSTRLKDLL
jgi:hypothetical protein